ncbi:MAG: hypothetical protein NTW20_10645 [Rhodobacterales bacterium]|nr:hypothetical protein [Rhodobacterales bacterium]
MAEFGGHGGDGVADVFKAFGGSVPSILDFMVQYAFAAKIASHPSAPLFGTSHSLNGFFSHGQILLGSALQPTKRVLELFAVAV